VLNETEVAKPLYYHGLSLQFQYKEVSGTLKKMPEAGGIDLGALTRRVEQLGGSRHFLLPT
jgi:hypothetical protein